jgi:hypothetical protein
MRQFWAKVVQCKSAFRTDGTIQYVVKLVWFNYLQQILNEGKTSPDHGQPRHVGEHCGFLGTL